MPKSTGFDDKSGCLSGSLHLPGKLSVWLINLVHQYNCSASKLTASLNNCYAMKKSFRSQCTLKRNKERTLARKLTANFWARFFTSINYRIRPNSRASAYIRNPGKGLCTLSLKHAFYRGFQIFRAKLPVGCNYIRS